MVEEEELGIAFCTRAKMRRKKARAGGRGWRIDGRPIKIDEKSMEINGNRGKSMEESMEIDGKTMENPWETPKIHRKSIIFHAFCFING